MYKDIIIFFIIFIIFSIFMFLIGSEPNIEVNNYYYQYVLFIPTILFLLFRYLSEKTNDDKVALKYWIGSIILAIFSWGWFFVYNSLYIW